MDPSKSSCPRTESRSLRVCELAEELRPREKLERVGSPDQLADAELLAILVKTGVHGCNAVEVSRNLINAFGTVQDLFAANWREIEAKHIPGVGHVKSLELNAAFELGRRGTRLSLERMRAHVLRTPRDIYESVLPFVARDEQENFIVLLLDNRHRLLCEPVKITRGTANSSPVHPREVFRDAIRRGAQAVIVAHNHPSGDATPSAEDLETTRRLVEVSRLVQIPLLDHVVIGAEGSAGPAYVSIRDSGAVEF